MFPFYIATKGIPTTTNQKWSQFYLEPWAYQVSSVPKLLFKESTLVHGVEQENDLSTNDSCPIKPGNFGYWWWLVMKEVKHILTWCGKHLQHVSALETTENFQRTKGTSHWDLWTWNIPKTPLDLKMTPDFYSSKLTNYTKLYPLTLSHLVSIFVSILSLGFWPALSG